MGNFVLPAALEKFAGATLPEAAKLMTAKGLAPLQPKELLTCVYALTLDPNEVLADTARTTLTKFPENIVKVAVDGGVGPDILDFLAKNTSYPAIFEAIALSNEATDETICFLGERGSARVVEIISNNQIRLLRCTQILDALGKNSQTGQAVIDRIFSFLQREGIIAADFGAKEAEVTIDDFAATLEPYDLPQDFQLPEDMLQDLKGEVPEEETAKNLFAKIMNMSITQKIQLAVKGNKEARSVLVRDANKLVSSAVIKSPKMNDDEILAIAGSKMVNDSVLRYISNKKEWRKAYRIQLALAANPRTPFDIAMGLLKMLRFNDLRDLARSKSVSNAVATAAKRMVQQKESKH